MDLPAAPRSFRSRTPEATRRAGASLARAWAALAEGAGLVVCVTGRLGAGKTVFAKGVADGLGLDGEQVSSPTFVLANQYQVPGGHALHHVDFYRLEEAAELEGIGFFDLMAPGALLLVEWGERFEHALPRERIDVAIAVGEGMLRVVEARATGAGPEAVLARWSESFAASD